MGWSLKKCLNALTYIILLLQPRLPQLTLSQANLFSIEVLRNTNWGHRTNPSNGSRFVSNWSSHWYNMESKPGRKLPRKFWYKFKFKIINCFTADCNHTNERPKRKFYRSSNPEKKKYAFEMWTSMQVLSLPVVMVVDFAERRCQFHLKIYISQCILISWKSY